MVRSFRGRVGLQRINRNVRPSQAGYTRNVRGQMKAIEDQITSIIDSAKNATPEILEEAFKPTFELAKTYTPKDTHALVNSGYLMTRQTGHGATVEIGFGKGGEPFYAVYVHERTDIPHDHPTRAKFLQVALEEDAGNIQRRITNGYKTATGIK